MDGHGSKHAWTSAALVLSLGAAIELAPFLGPAAFPHHALAAAAALCGLFLLWSGLRRAKEPMPDATPSPQSAAKETASAASSLEGLQQELSRLSGIEKQLASVKKEAEAALMAKGEFLATMSHEIRTPLNGIIPLLDILLATKLNEDQREYALTAYQSARQLLSIVDDILDYSKIEANKLELEVVNLNLRDLIDSVTRLMAKNAEKKHLRLTTTIDANVRLALRGDPVRLRQILTNLVSNAIKFTERGAVTIEVKKKGETRTHVELTFSVKDTGIGMSSDLQRRLFTPFTQADASTTRIHGGTGLGLVICKRIVDLMRGQIGAVSEPGRGSTFWFSVSLHKALGDIAPSRTQLQGAQALLVTTDLNLSKRLRFYLSNHGVTLHTISLATEALNKLRAAAPLGDNWAYDFLVVDWANIKNAGINLAKTALREQPLEQVRIILIGDAADIPEEIAKHPRCLLHPPQSQDNDLRIAMQNFLSSSQVTAPAQAESLLDETDLAAARALAQTPASTTGNGGRSLPVDPHGSRVLLVEDNAVNRQVAQRLLQVIGIASDIAENGAEALEKLKLNPYAAVLMDCQMPVMDGYATTKAIRELERSGQRRTRMPIIAMTANAMAGDQEKCLSIGMDAYLSKPLNRELLKSTLAQWLNQDIPLPAKPLTAETIAAPRATTEEPKSTAAINLDMIQDLREIMGADFPQLVKLFLEDAPKLIDALKAATERNDMTALIAPAHSLKSASANLGAINLSRLAKQLEHGGKTGHLPRKPNALVAELAAEFQQAATDLRGLLPSLD